MTVSGVPKLAFCCRPCDAGSQCRGTGRPGQERAPRQRLSTDSRLRHRFSSLAFIRPIVARQIAGGNRWPRRNPAMRVRKTMPSISRGGFDPPRVLHFLGTIKERGSDGVRSADQERPHRRWVGDAGFPRRCRGQGRQDRRDRQIERSRQRGRSTPRAGSSRPGSSTTTAITMRRSPGTRCAPFPVTTAPPR